MALRTVCKELLRTPIKTLLFLLMLALATALLVLGVNLYCSCETARQEVSQNYKTVGTVEQVPDSTMSEEEREHYVFMSTEEDPYGLFTKQIPEDAFDGLPTKGPVENRPTLITTGEFDAKLSAKGPAGFNVPYRLSAAQVIMFSVDNLLDTDDEESMQLYECNYARFQFPATLLELNGYRLTEAEQEQHQMRLYWPYNENEHVRLEPGVEYIAWCEPGYGGGVEMTFFLQRMTRPEAVGKTWMESYQFPQIVYENSEGFESTEAGQWMQYLMDYSHKIEEISNQTVITVPTSSLSLLDPFYREAVTIKYGRAITEEEFASGAKVCLIPDTFRTYPDFMNLVDVGDKVRLDWRGAVYGWAPSLFSQVEGYQATPVSTSMLDIEGSEEYEVVGIYVQEDGADNYLANGSGMNLGAYEIIVPSASYDFDSITPIFGGTIEPGCCSFLLENGSSQAFLEAWEKSEYSEQVHISLNDQGYTAIAKGLDAVSLLSFILMLSGGISVLCLLFFFVYLQIARRQREAAIQLSLGVSKRRCAAFLLLSVLLIAFAGIALGAGAGHMVTNQVSSQVYSQAKESGYSREYSDQFEASQDKAYDYDSSASWQLALWAGLGTVAAALLLSSAVTAQTLRKEPLEQLTRKE